MKFLTRILLLINMIVVFATLISYAAPYVDPKYTWLFSIFGLGFPIFLLLNIGFVFFWTMQKPRFALISLLCLLLGWNHIKGFIAFNGANIEADGNAFELVSFNVSNAFFGYDSRKKNMKEVRQNYKELIDQLSDADVLCLQEVRTDALKIIKEKFPKYNMHQVEKGAIIISRFPIIKKGEIDFGTITNSCVWADIRLKSDTVRIYSFHLKSNRISSDAEKLANADSLTTDRAWYDIKSMLRKFKNNHIGRSKQAEKVNAHVLKSPYPVILAGDMNDTPVSYTYKVFSEQRKDAFRERGMGIGTTYAGIIPLLRIDYIFLDKSLRVSQFDVIRQKVSDHYPIIATILTEDAP